MADYYHLFLVHTHFIWLVRIKRKIFFAGLIIKCPNSGGSGYFTLNL